MNNMEIQRMEKELFFKNKVLTEVANNNDKVEMTNSILKFVFDEMFNSRYYDGLEEEQKEKLYEMSKKLPNFVDYLLDK